MKEQVLQGIFEKEELELVIAVEVCLEKLDYFKILFRRNP